MSKTVSLCALISISISMLMFAGPSSAVSDHHVLLLDMNRDGLDLSAITATGLFSDGSTSDLLRWTKASSDDAFMVVDATALRATIGYDISDGDTGTAIEGPTLFRDGLRITPPGGGGTVTTDGWDMLRLLDNDTDGRLDASAPAWQHLYLYKDEDGGGEMDGTELSLADPILKSFFQTGDFPTQDQFHNRYSPGGYELLDDTAGYAASVDLQEVPEPGSFGLVALGLALLRRRTR